MKINYCLFMLILFLGCKKGDNPISSLTYEEALSQQMIKYDLQDRHYHLTEFNEAASPSLPCDFPGEIIWPTTFGELPSGSTVFSRFICAYVPNEQSAENHFESIAFQFAKIMDENLIDLNTNRLHSNEVFQNDFLTIGNLNSENLKGGIGYIQTYFLSTSAELEEEGNSPEIIITEVVKLTDNENAFLISGTFKTTWDWAENYWGSNFTNGEFKILIEN